MAPALLNKIWVHNKNGRYHNKEQRHTPGIEINPVTQVVARHANQLGQSIYSWECVKLTDDRHLINRGNESKAESFYSDGSARFESRRPKGEIHFDFVTIFSSNERRKIAQSDGDGDVSKLCWFGSVRFSDHVRIAKECDLFRSLSPNTVEVVRQQEIVI